MKRFVLLLLPLVLLSCKSGPEKINANLEDLRNHAERDDRDAQWELGDAYMKLGNWAEANQWLRKAAENGVVKAQYQLGQNYEKGTGISQDYIEAYAWCALAADKGHVMAMNARERLTRWLSHEDLEEANRRMFTYATKIPGKEPRSNSSSKPAKSENKPKADAPKQSD